MFSHRVKKIIVPITLALTLGAVLFFASSAWAQGSTNTLGLAPLQSELGLPAVDIRIVVARIIRVALSLLGIVALGLMLYAGFIWMTAGGNEEKIGQAKKIMVNAAIGLAIVLSSYSIVSFVINKLVSATTGGPGEGIGGGGGGGNPYFPRDAFYVDQLPAGGNVCVRNVHPAVVFNRNVLLDNDLQQNIVVEKTANGAAAPGAWKYGGQKNVIIFAPSGDCGGGPADCLEASSTYRLVFKDTNQIKAEGSDARLNCNIKANCKNPVTFTTGAGVDRNPPQLFIDYPTTSTPIQQGQVVPVKVRYTDDNGVQNISLRADGFFVGSQAIAGCKQTDTVTIQWPTQWVSAGQHLLESSGYDWAALEGKASASVSVRPPHCFNGVKDGDETQVDCGGSCGRCGGDACTSDEQCAGGFCEIPPGKTEGVCVDKMRILDVSPLSGGSGTYVSLLGLYFGNSPGAVYFATNTNPALGDWLPAKLVQCTGNFKSWNPWQILVEAPSTTPGFKGPLMVVTASTTGRDGIERKFIDLTNDNWGAKIPSWEFTNQTRPGLCGVNPESAPSGDQVKLQGKNLGLFGGSSAVLFGTQKGTISQLLKNGNINWTPTVINEVFVPFLDPGAIGVKVLDSQGTESNGLRFVVQAGVSADAPIISSVSPSVGGRGSYITISGKNFGNIQGEVYFIDPNDRNNPIKGNFNFPEVCSSEIWRDSQIIVRFDRELGKIGTSYVVRVVTSAGKQTSFDVNYSFTVEAGTPAPGVCKIDPVSGPVPLGGGRFVTLSGSYFGNTPEVYFWATGADPKTIQGRKKSGTVVTSTDRGADVATTTPQAGSATGPVVVYRSSDKKLSNPVNFTVNDCTKQDTCGALGDYRCCSSGLDVGLCKPKAELCAGETRSTAYIWRFATQDIVAAPRVVERCDKDTDEGKNIPTPSPSVLWDGNDIKGDHHQVCRGAVITTEFTTALDKNTVSANTVKINVCTNVNGNNCEVDKNVSITLDPDSFKLRPVAGLPGGAVKHYLEIKQKDGQPWEPNTWYQVTLGSGIKSAGTATTSLPLSKDRPCGNAPDAAYCFVFKAGASDCALSKVIVSPYYYWTDALEAPMKYRVLGKISDDVIYRGNGLSTQRCIMMNMDGFEWQWDTSDAEYAVIYGPSKQREVKVESRANTVNVAPNDVVNIRTEASTTTAQQTVKKSGASALTIDLTKPAVRGNWPNCLEACTNAEIGAEFNVPMSDFQVNWTSIRLSQCLDENCLSLKTITTSTLPSFNKSNRRILSLPHDELVPGAQYIVSLSSDKVANQQLWSAGRLKDPQSKSAPFTQEFKWRFRTKNERCKIDRVEVDPKEYQAQFLNDRTVYTVQPFSAPDACDSQGQRINPWLVNWDWKSQDEQVATVQTFSTVGQNRYCTPECIKKGSDVPVGVGAIYPVCGNAKVEAGEDCDEPLKSAGCGLDCRFLGNTDPKTCGDGKTDNKVGEACDPKDKDTQIGCSADCRRLGSVPASQVKDVTASICGNGFIGSGEDCDLGIAQDINTPTSSLGCSEKCLHLGTRLSLAWCAKHVGPGVVNTSGFPDAEVKAACEGAYSQCGDGRTDPDEDAGCDLGKGKREAFCSDYCLINDKAKPKPGCNKVGDEGCTDALQYQGSSLLYSKPSVCGDKIVGIGEDAFCEDKNYLMIVRSSLIDPWTLATGVGKGVGQGVPPSQSTDITGSTKDQTKGGVVSGSGKFVIACGYKTDAECQAAHKSPDYGVGKDSCCYLKPQLTKVYPGSTSTIQENICTNTYIEASFQGIMDQNSIPGNLLIARGTLGTGNASPTPVYQAHLDTNKEPQAKLAGAIAVAVSGQRAYVSAQLDNAVEVVDVASANNPKHLWSITNGDQGAKLVNPTGLVVENDTLYVTANNSFQIIDLVAVAGNYKVRGSLNHGQIVNQQTARLSGSDHGIAAVGNYVWVTSYSQSTLQVIDITNKDNPVPVASLTDQEKGPNGQAAKLAGALPIALQNGFAYVGGTGGNIQIIDVRDPKKLDPLGSVSGLGQIYGLGVSGDFVYAVSYSDHALWIVSVKDKNKPVLVGTLKNGEGGAKLKNAVGIRVVGQYAFITTNDGQNPKNDQAAFEVVNIASSTAPRHAASLPPKLFQPYGIAVSGDYAYMTDYSGGALEIIQITDFVKAVSCPEDVTKLVTSAEGVNIAPRPWYLRLWHKLLAFIQKGLGATAEAVPPPQPTRWCAGADIGTATVVKTPGKDNSRIVVRLAAPLQPNAYYAIVLKDGLTDTRGVSLGTDTVKKRFWQWRFATRPEGICTVKGVQVNPETVFFSRANTSSTLEAVATGLGGVKLQSMPGYYEWDYLWRPDNPYVLLSKTTSSLNVITAQNQNGSVDIGATAVITKDVIGKTLGTVATGRSAATVFLCENPWPPKDYYVESGGQRTGPFDIFPYEDTPGNNDGYDQVANIFDSTAIPKTNPVVGDGYFNFSTFYCADSGSVGKVDDLPYLKPTVQADAATIQVTRGACEITGRSCDADNDCGQQLTTSTPQGIKSFLFAANTDGVCGTVTTTAPRLRVFTDEKGNSLGCFDANQDCTSGAFKSWLGAQGGTPACFTSGNKRALKCQKNLALKRWIMTNNQNNDVIGVQVFSNPRHLSASEWYEGKKVLGGEEFVGSPRRLAVGGYDAVGDDNNIYIDSLNYASSTKNLYSNIYLLSINNNAKSETRQVFEQLLGNLKFNINLTNYGSCGPRFDEPRFERGCVSDLDCVDGQVCSNQIDALKRNYRRVKDFKALDQALEGYAKRTGSYPDLPGGTFLKGQTISPWTSWVSALGNALGGVAPVDPINQLAVAGTCTPSSTIFCTTDGMCPKGQACSLHDPATGWSTLDRRFSFACASSSYAYRYIFSSSTGYAVRSRFEPDGLETPKNFAAFIDSFGFTDKSRFGLSQGWPLTICQYDKETMSVNQGKCGDGQINWGRGEMCDPPGTKVYDQRICLTNPQGQIMVQECGQNCGWKQPTKIACADLSKFGLSKCGNGKKEPDELCDDGVLNGTYNHCNKDCKDFGAAGMCGDGQLQSKFEVCDVKQLAQGGPPICQSGVNKGNACAEDYDCNPSPYSEPLFIVPGKDIWDGAYFKEMVCREINPRTPDTDYECTLTSNHPSQDGQTSPASAYINLLLKNCSDTECAIAMSQTIADYFSSVKQVPTQLPARYSIARCSNKIPSAQEGVVYGMKKEDSCSFDCQNYGPYCGDKIVQSEFGESCDGSQTCSVDGKSGERVCGSCKMKDDSALVGWWRLDDGNVKTFVDSSGKNNTATCAGNECPAFVPEGKVAGAVKFDSGDFIKVEHSDSLNLKAFTVEAWIKTQANVSLGPAWVNIVKAQKDFADPQNQAGDRDFAIAYSKKNSSQIKEISLNSISAFGLAAAELDKPYNNNEWHHIVVTASGTDPVRFYSDGELVKNVKVLMPPVFGKAADRNFPLFIHNFEEPIDEVKIYNRALLPGEVKDHFNNNWVCQVKGLKESAQAIQGTCGDGQVDLKTEVCDNGTGKNGAVCVPTYGKSCSYCAEDCKHIIDVQPTEYCGDGIIQPAEQCDTDPVSKKIYAKIQSATTTYSTPVSGGYEVRLCADEPQLRQPPKDGVGTVAKGTKLCVNNCQSITIKESGGNSCILCGSVETTKGVEVGGEIVSAVDPGGAPFAETPVKNIDLYMSKTPWNYLNIHSYGILGRDYVLNRAAGNDKSKPTAEIERAFIAYHPICSTGEDPNYRIIVNTDPQIGPDKEHTFDIDVFSKPADGLYDLVLSPTIDSKIRPEDIRIVISWVGDMAFQGGFFMPGEEDPNKKHLFERDSFKKKITGLQYYQLNDFSDMIYGIWYHGTNKTKNKTNVESFTIHTGTVGTAWQHMANIGSADQYAFYVRALGDPMRSYKSNAKLKVEVYLPKDYSRFTFARPYKTFYLEQSGDSPNPNAPYWYVFNIEAPWTGEGGDVRNLPMSDRVVEVNKIVTEFKAQ